MKISVNDSCNANSGVATMVTMVRQNQGTVCDHNFVSYPHILLSLAYVFSYPYIFSLLSKNESGLIKLTACLSVCPPLITFEPIGGFS
jgi:hypothetical protein